MMDAEQQNQIQIKRDALNMNVMSLKPEHFQDLAHVGSILTELEEFASLMDGLEQPQFSKILKELGHQLGQIVAELSPYESSLEEFQQLHEQFDNALELLYAGDQEDADKILIHALDSKSTAGKNLESQDHYSDYAEIIQHCTAEMKGDETLAEFISETEEGLQNTEETLLRLEEDFEDQKAISSIFRVFHTIKGTAGFLGLTDLGSLAHRTEDLMVQVNEGEREITLEILNAILCATDGLSKLISQMKAMIAGMSSDPVDLREAYQLLDYLLSDEVSRSASVLENPTLETISVTSPPHSEDQEALTETHPEVGQNLANTSKSPTTEFTKTNENVAATQVMDMLKIPAFKLDELSEFIGEMVVALSVLSQNPTIANLEDRELHDRLDQLNKITEQLRDRILSIRMFPVKNVFSKLTRQMRDLSKKSGKQVKLTIQGDETLVDKTIIDSIYAPLMHIMRNTVDHGIETPEERIAAGKSSEGTVKLSAHHLGDSILIEVRDDGRGLDRQKLLSKALERGLINERENLTDQQIFMFIFTSGVSTAKEVTDISGRGVGMDVVKKEVEKLRGKISVETEAGKGTAFLIKLPLTTSIIEGLVVRLGENRFVLPILDVHLTLIPKKEQLYDVQDRESECLILAGEVIPIMRLHEFFDVEADVMVPEEAIIVVVKYGDKKYGLMVDELLHRQQIVVKNLGETFVNLPGITGGTILGDGRVGLILDPETLIHRSHNINMTIN
ncbi:MAG: chemotaxis protein CheA [Proteobacteria bacterium]|nr:chemotaxis protein CheA [Pseudomonadota bacterium]